MENWNGSKFYRCWFFLYFDLFRSGMHFHSFQQTVLRVVWFWKQNCWPNRIVVFHLKCLWMYFDKKFADGWKWCLWTDKGRLQWQWYASPFLEMHNRKEWQ